MQAEQLRELVVAALDDMKAVNTVTLDVTGLTDMMDYLVVTSGTSNRHVKSLAEQVVQQAKRAGVQPLGIEGEEHGEWVLVDVEDVLVHLMIPRVRDFYNLEKLWSPASVASAAETVG